MCLPLLQEIHAKQQLSKSRAAGLGDDEYEGFLELHAMLPKKKGRFSDEQASSDGCFEQVSGLQVAQLLSACPGCPKTSRRLRIVQASSCRGHRGQ